MLPVPRKIRIAGPPVHPMLAGFPIALFTMSFIWEIVALLDARWWLFSFWNLVAGLALAAPTVITGLIDHAAVPRGSPAEKTGLWHPSANFTALLSFGGSLIAMGGPAPPASGRMTLALGLSAFGLAVIFAGGWLGGHLVFRHGVGVERAEGDRPAAGRPPAP